MKRPFRSTLMGSLFGAALLFALPAQGARNYYFS